MSGFNGYYIEDRWDLDDVENVLSQTDYKFNEDEKRCVLWRMCHEAESPLSFDLMFEAVEYVKEHGVFVDKKLLYPEKQGE